VGDAEARSRGTLRGVGRAVEQVGEEDVVQLHHSEYLVSGMYRWLYIARRSRTRWYYLPANFFFRHARNSGENCSCFGRPCNGNSGCPAIDFSIVSFSSCSQTRLIAQSSLSG
jgi:hypothetical protein